MNNLTFQSEKNQNPQKSIKDSHWGAAIHNLRNPSEEGDFLNKTKSSPSIGYQNIHQILEGERHRISEALHNHLGQLLYIMRLKLSRIENLAEKDSKHLAEIEALINEAIIATKTISFEVMPHTLSKGGLKLTIEELCKKISNDKLKIQTQVEVTKRFDPFFENVIFRTVQELINNIIKHSGADQAVIKVIEHHNLFEIEAKDNGCGFDIQNVDTYKGMGLTYLTNNVNLLNGTMNISSQIGKGTLIQIKFKQQ